MLETAKPRPAWRNSDITAKFPTQKSSERLQAVPSSSPALRCSGFAFPQSTPWSTSHRAGQARCSERGEKQDHPCDHLYLISNLLAQPYSLIQGEARHQLCGQDVLAAQLIHYSWDIKEGVVFQQLPRGWRKERKRLGAVKAARPLRNTSHSTQPLHTTSPHTLAGAASTRFPQQLQ